MKAVISVVGKDTVGILAKVSNSCAQKNINVSDVSQTVLQEMFCMIMICDIDNMNVPFERFADDMTVLGTENNLCIHVMHEDIFNSMHSI